MKNKSLKTGLIICVISAVASFSASCNRNRAIPDTDSTPSSQHATENEALPDEDHANAEVNPQIADTAQNAPEIDDTLSDEEDKPSSEPGKVPVGEICNEGNCPCGKGFCPKGAVCDGKTCICGINRDEKYKADITKPCGEDIGVYSGYTCQPLAKEPHKRGFDSVWASSVHYGEFSCEYLDVKNRSTSSTDPERKYIPSLLWGFMCKNPNGCYHRTEHYAPVPPDFNLRSEKVPGKNFRDSRFAEWPDLDYEWNDSQARVFTAVTHYDRDKCPYHIDGDTDTTEETICWTGDCVLPRKDGVCSLIADHQEWADSRIMQFRLLQFDAAACPGGTLYCHGRANDPIARPEVPQGYACQIMTDSNGKVQRELKSWVCNAGDCRCGDDLCFYGNACLCGGKACLADSVCYNGRCIPQEEVPDKEGKVFRRPRLKSQTRLNQNSCDYYYTTDPEYLGYCGSELAETIQQNTKLRDDFAGLLATLKIIPGSSIENDRCLIRRMCDLQNVPPEKRSQYVCDHGLFMLETNQPGEYIAADRPLGLRCNDPKGCTCGDLICPNKSICTNNRNNEEDKTYCRYDSIFMMDVCDKPTVDMNDITSMIMFWKSYKDKISEYTVKDKDECPAMKGEWEKHADQSWKLSSGLNDLYKGDNSITIEDLIKSNRIEFKNSDAKWESVKSDYGLPGFKVSADKDLAKELSVITKKECTKLGDKVVSNGTSIQVFECEPSDADKLMSEYMDLRYKHQCDNVRYHHDDTQEMAKKCAEIDNIEAVLIYMAFVAQNDKYASVYKVNSGYDTMDKYMNCAGPDNEPDPSFELVDATQNSWLDTTAYTIRIKSSYETAHDHACDDPCGCDVINSYNTLHSYVFAGNEFRPVADWREIDLWEQVDYMVGEWLYNKEEEECEGLDDDDEYEKCRYKHDENGDRIMDPKSECPSYSLNGIDCQKAVLDGKDLSITKVKCK